MLALGAAPGLASFAAAQGRSTEDIKTIDGYRLTMPMVRKVLPALYAPGAERCPKPKHPTCIPSAWLRWPARSSSALP